MNFFKFSLRVFAIRSIATQFVKIQPKEEGRRKKEEGRRKKEEGKCNSPEWCLQSKTS
ncbi:hypothetical protein QT971_18115 [Microcoleus sp. herbarium19]|uniref:hypothetical protein n=1 Tax=Microcoleus sp. herbarium13 TaxID=3055438 RepID=UPI002FD549BF